MWEVDVTRYIALCWNYTFVKVFGGSKEDNMGWTCNSNNN
jgi:hypothetical protein